MKITFASLSLALGQARGAMIRGSIPSTALEEQAGAVTENMAGFKSRVEQDVSEFSSVSHQDLTRRLAKFSDFVPLACNAALPNAKCQSWTSRFGTENVHTERVILPCGECIVMDHAGPELTFLDGLDVHGKLVFEDGYKLIVNSNMIAVQGELDMTSTKPLDGVPDVQFFMTGEEDEYFQPIDSNAMACGAEMCKAGKKAIAVAGGKMYVKGIPDDTPAWLKLYDVAGGEGGLRNTYDPDYPRYTPPPSLKGCPQDGRFFAEDFHSIKEQGGLTGTLGSDFHFTGHSIKVKNRLSTYHGVQFDLKKMRHCLVPEVKYLFTARVLLHKPGEDTGALTSCAASGSDCMTLSYDTMKSTGTRQGKAKWNELQSFQSQYGVPFTIAKEIKFSATELDASDVYQSLQLYGMEEDVEIELDTFVLEMPNEKLFADPSDVCKNLVPANGDAEVGGLSPFPLYGNNRFVNVVVDHEADGNHFFKVTGRRYAEFSSNAEDKDGRQVGLGWFISKACLVEGSILKFSASVRAHPTLDQPGPFVMNARIMANRDHAKDSYGILATCPPSDGKEWVHCEGTYTVPEGLLVDQVTAFSFRFDTDPSIAYDVDNLSLTVEGGSPSAIIVSDQVKGKWTSGASIVVTSHTNQWDAYQVRTIEQVSDHLKTGWARIDLDSPIVRPTTLLDSSDFAVEVAILSRNILFQGGPDSNSLHGGHFWIRHTPKVQQHLEGLEVRNFGQQGTLGRYPIHFHFCGDNEGSTVRKNLVRDSNQRAFVVHGTHNLLIEENVAFDTKGHAFLLEDGYETGNKFIRNLGAGTDRVDVTIPNDGFNGKETDKEPSTFWISNPTNVFKGNVAAGSRGSGYWFELQLRGQRASLFPDLNPRFESLTLFADNAAHSNTNRGLRTYPKGFLPDEKAHIVGLKSYRNGNNGLFFHNTQNVAVVDSLFSDNRVALDVDQSDDIIIRNTTIVGMSKLFHDITVSQDAPGVCRYRNQPSTLVGMEIHSFVSRSEKRGATIDDVRFEGFNNSDCDDAVHFYFDDSTRLGTFDWFTTIKDVSVQPGLKNADFCAAEANGVVDAYLIDLDGSLRPDPAAKPGTTSSLVSDNVNLMAFVDSGFCETVDAGCYVYCHETCIRSIRYEIDPSFTSNYRLKVCAIDTGKCMELQDQGHVDARKSTNFRTFNAHLPAGAYDAVFLDHTGGHAAWPSFVMATYQDKLCPTAIEDGAVSLIEPMVEVSQCENLIRNGNFEQDDMFWLHRSGGLQVIHGHGIEGSAALTEVGKETVKDAFVQFMDSRCLRLMQGRAYEITAMVLLTDTTGMRHMCNPRTEDCPTIGISAPGRSEVVGTIIPQYDDGQFQLVHGVLKIDEELAAADRLELSITRNRLDLGMVVDNVAAILISSDVQSSEQCEGNLVVNGDFSGGDSRFWTESTTINTVIDTNADGPSDYALALFNENGGYGRTALRTGCLVAGERYQVSAQFKALDEGQNPVTCDNGSSSSSSASQCPTARIYAYKKGEVVHKGDVAAAIGQPLSSDWNRLHGVFVASEESAEADNLSLYLTNLLDAGSTVIVDKVVIQHMPQHCSGNVIVNSNMEMGAMNFWKPQGPCTVTTMPAPHILKGSKGTALVTRDRDATHNGIVYNTAEYMDERCLTPGSLWEIRARIHLMHGTEPASCQMGSAAAAQSACPAIIFDIKGASDGQSIFSSSTGYRSYTTSEWQIEGWNEFRQTVKLPTDWDGSVRSVYLAVRDFPIDLDVMVDDFEIVKVETMQ